MKIAYGLPQGSILGTLFFLVYINDIPEISKLAKFIIYVDDADTTENNHIQLFNLKTNLVKLKWVRCNGLYLKKTKYMICSRSKADLPSPLVISQMPTERKIETRFLGFIIDESLKWSGHVKIVLSKMWRYEGITYKIKKLRPLKACLQVTTALFSHTLTTVRRCKAFV